jgi:hypothetical protein
MARELNDLGRELFETAALCDADHVRDTLPRVDASRVTPWRTPWTQSERSRERITFGKKPGIASK